MYIGNNAGRHSGVFSTMTPYILGFLALPLLILEVIVVWKYIDVHYYYTEFNKGFVVFVLIIILIGCVNFITTGES